MENLGNNFVSARKIGISPIEGSISHLMKEKVRSLNSLCEDKFDWSIYDELHSRYSSNLPYWGVVFKTTLRLVNHLSSCSKCHYSFEIDTYGRGCSHDCVFCYAKVQLSSHGAWNKPQPFPVDLAEIRKIFYTVFETDRSSKWRDILSQYIPLRLGAMSDPFMHIDRRYGVTKEFLRILDYYKYPLVIFTRSDLVADDDYLSVMNPERVSIQFSICGGNEKLTRKLEPAAPSVSRRLDAVQRLTALGYWTAVRINPLFPIYPDGYFTDTSGLKKQFGSLNQIPKFELFDFGFIDRLAETNVSTVIAGFVRLSSVSLNNIRKACGVDLARFFWNAPASAQRNKNYSDNEINFYYREIQRRCVALGLRFSTCYIGNGIKDYYNYQDLWENKKDCCDIRGNVSSFRSSSQDVDWSQRLKHTTDKEAALSARHEEMFFAQMKSVSSSNAPFSASREGNA